MGAGPLRASALAEPIGVIVALPAEARTLRAAGAGTRPAGVRVFVCGVGHARAARAAADALDAGCRGLVSWGTAAGLAPDLPPGALVIAEAVATAETPGARLACDGAWARGLGAALAGAGARRGGILQVPALLRAPADKAALHRETRALAADMESAAIAAVAAARGARWVAVRAVVDDAATGLPESIAASLVDGELSARALLGHLLLAPGELPALVRLGLAFRRAREGLARAARVLEW